MDIQDLPDPRHLNLYEIPRNFDESVLIDFENVDRERNVGVSEQLELVKANRLELQRQQTQQVFSRSTDSSNLGRAFDSLAQ